MGPRKYVVIAIGFALFWSGSACLGTGVPALHISELVGQSDTVVVADVSEIRTVGPAAIDFHGSILSAERYRVEAVALYTLTGTCPEHFDVEFVLPNSPTGYRSVKPGTRMLFLKKSGATYNPTSPYYPDLPALRSEPTEFQGDGAALVFAELGAVIASADAPLEYKREVLARPYAIPNSNKLFLDDLLVGLRNTSDPDLHRRIQAELISRNDISELPDVCGALLADSVSANQKPVLLYVIAQHLRNEKAVPALTQLLQSHDPEVRLASIESLWHIAAPSSIRALTEALGDQNSDVRYYAIRGLADVTGEQQWGPSPAEYEEHEAKYRQHWLDWAAQNKAVGPQNNR